MSAMYKIFDIKTIDKRENGGRIRINTAGFDRDNDRVFPRGAKIENYHKNPVVQYGHNYRDPWATIGRTNELDITEEYIEADFDLRPAANDNDPQSIVLLLWNGNWINAASIGFMPGEKKGNPNNDMGGIDYMDWELLEWSLVSIPANQDALRQGLGKIFDISNTDEEYNEEPEGEPDGEPEGDPDVETQQADSEPPTDDTSHDESQLTPEVLGEISNFINAVAETVTRSKP